MLGPTGSTCDSCHRHDDSAGQNNVVPVERPPCGDVDVVSSLAVSESKLVVGLTGGSNERDAVFNKE